MPKSIPIAGALAILCDLYLVLRVFGTFLNLIKLEYLETMKCNEIRVKF